MLLIAVSKKNVTHCYLSSINTVYRRVLTLLNPYVGVFLFCFFSLKMKSYVGVVAAVPLYLFNGIKCRICLPGTAFSVNLVEVSDSRWVR